MAVVSVTYCLAEGSRQRVIIERIASRLKKERKKDETEETVAVGGGSGAAAVANSR